MKAGAETLAFSFSDRRFSWIRSPSLSFQSWLIVDQSVMRWDSVCCPAWYLFLDSRPSRWSWH